MFQFVHADHARKFALALALSLGLICAGAGAAAWYASRCSVLDYLDRASASPNNPSEQYLFACGHVWRSADSGHLWTRLATKGLPLGAQDGHIAVDRRPGFLYLGLLITSRSSIYCWQCAITYLRPAVYISADGGRTWSFAYKFKRGPAAAVGFLGLFADPAQEGRAWAVVTNDGQINYYATATAGKFWKVSCSEYYLPGSLGCKLPFNIVNSDIGPGAFDNAK